jgi:membrane protein DedA with SNARE-associated domain
MSDIPPRQPESGDPEPGRDTNAITGQFIRELIVFLVGLLLGFFWFTYSNQSPSPETHIVIGLLVIIMCLVRFIFLYMKR